jgi:RNA polymerase sigma factor (sigma-70 family)
MRSINLQSIIAMKLRKNISRRNATFIIFICQIGGVKQLIENIQEDQKLVSRILKGDTKAFSIIVKNTEGLVAQIVFKMIPNNEDRKDLAQDVYLKAFNNLSGFRFQSKISTWIGQITYNVCLNYLERKKLVFPGNNSNGKYTDDESLEMLSIDKFPFKNETEDIIFRKDLSAILKTELENLSPLYKTLITLYHNEELNYAEIAVITNLPEGTVKNYLFRARKIIRENILLIYKKEAL